MPHYPNRRIATAALLIVLLTVLGLFWRQADSRESKEIRSVGSTSPIELEVGATAVTETIPEISLATDDTISAVVVRPQNNVALQVLEAVAQGPLEIPIQLPTGDWKVLDLSTWRSLGNDGAESQWTGSLKGQAGSQVVVTRWKGAVFGSVFGAQGSFEIRERTDGKLAVFPIDSLACEVDADGIGDLGESVLDYDQDGATGSTISIVIGYNQQAVDSLGGVGPLEAKILSAVALANLSYAYSNIDMKLGLSWLGLVDYVYSENQSFSEALISARNPTDGNADLLAQKREEYGADFASLWLASDYTGGLATVLYAGSSPSGAYSIIRAKNPLETFIHEVGHNMGCRHLRDSYTSAVNSWYPYSYANVFVGNNAQKYVTVMASTGNESDEGATRIPYFSGPDVIYQGVSTGVLGDTNCALTLRDNAAIYEDFADLVPMFADVQPGSVTNLVTLANGFVGEDYRLASAGDLSAWGQVSIGSADNDGNLSGSAPKSANPVFYRWELVE